MTLPYPHLNLRKVWFGQLPGHWTTLKTKVLFRNARDRKLDNDEQLSATQKYGVIPQRLFMEQEDTRVMLALSGTESFKHVDRDDFVISLRSFEGGFERCFYDGCVSPAYTVMKSNLDLSPGYFHHLFKSRLFIQEMQLGVYGIRDGKAVNFDDVARIRLPVPPVDEQEAIASYLDAETKRIDELFQEKKKLLALLEEARFAAVERAIRPSSEFRAQPLKRFVEALSTGPFGSALHSSDYISGGISVINPTHIINGQVVPDDEVSIAEEMAEALSAYRLKPNDIVVGRRGEMGRCAVVPSGVNDWLCGTGCLMCTPDASKILPDYLQLVVSSRASREWLSLESVGTTMENLNTEILGRLPCFVPAIEEQQERLREISREISGLASLKAHVDSEMNLLQELRSSTITDAVLGRIDVRELMAT